MFSWITGPRITNAIEDLQPDLGYESTFIDAPETPAHQFVGKALKRVVFGTPAPDDANTVGKKLQKKQSPDLAATKVPTIAAPKEDAPPISPSKQPGGILMTPGTANKGRKSVSFGAHVVDNEGKRGNAGRSGIPDDCPGKFPSPRNPGTELKAGADSEQKPRTKLTAALMDARTTTQPRSGQKPKSKDDSDITMDLGAPRSDSGKYWKEQYEAYTARSEKEVKKLIAKQQIARNYAMKKDGEVTELVTKLEQERKRYRRREHDLEQQIKEFQERLRKAMSEQLSAGVEITALKNRIATLETPAASTSEAQQIKSSSPFEIFEDTSKRAEAAQAEQDQVADASYLSQKVRVLSAGKENSPPRPRHLRRQTLPEPSSLQRLSPSATPRLGVEAGQVSTILGRSTRAAVRENELIARPPTAPKSQEPSSTPTLSVRKSESRHQNVPKSPTQLAPSSPLPLGSPDPWMEDADEASSIAQFDRMAIPLGYGGGGGSYSRPSKPARRRRQDAPKSGSQSSKPVERSRPKGDSERPPPSASKRTPYVPTNAVSDKPEGVLNSTATTKEPVRLSGSLAPSTRKDEEVKPSSALPAEPKSDNSKVASHAVGGSSQAKKDRATGDRKEEAKRRLAEKKQRKKEMAT